MRNRASFYEYRGLSASRHAAAGAFRIRHTGWKRLHFTRRPSAEREVGDHCSGGQRRNQRRCSDCRHYKNYLHQATPHGINPALGGTVIISGLTPDGFQWNLSGNWRAALPILGRSPMPSRACRMMWKRIPRPRRVECSTVRPTTPSTPHDLLPAAAINPTTRTFAAADYNASSNQIQFIGTLDQNLTSLSLTCGQLQWLHAESQWSARNGISIPWRSIRILTSCLHMIPRTKWDRISRPMRSR